MLSKEDLILRVQQGIPDPNWTVIRPKSSYFLGQLALWLVLTLLTIGATLYYLNSPTHALVFIGASIDSDAALQSWRTIDFVLFGLLMIAFLSMLAVQMLDLLAIERQMLVSTPEAVFIGLRRKEHFVAYTGVSNIVPTTQRDGTVKLLIQASTGRTTLSLDKRFGPPKELAARIVAAWRQWVTASKS